MENRVGLLWMAVLASLSPSTRFLNAEPVYKPRIEPFTRNRSADQSPSCNCTPAWATGDDLPSGLSGTRRPQSHPRDIGVAGAPCAPIVLSQNLSDVVNAGVACSLQDSNYNFCYSGANAYARSFNLASIPEVAGKPFIVRCVSFGVRANITLNNPNPDCGPGGPGGDFTVGINLYRDTNGGAPVRHDIDLELLGGTSVVVPLGTQNVSMRATFDPPIRVDPDTVLVVELFAPTRVPMSGGDGGFFVGGFNGAGETTPGFLLAPDCGNTTFTPLNIIVPWHLMLNVQGNISRMEFIDPNPNLLVPAPEGSPPAAFIVDLSSFLVGDGRVVEGAAADGATQVLVRITVDGPGEVQLDLADLSASGEDIGELRPRTGGAGSTSVTVPVEVYTPFGGETTYVAFALYTAPLDFASSPSSPMASEAERLVSVTATYTPDGGSPETIDVNELTIVRPPVALVHGLHDEGASWQWALKDDPRFNVHVIDYSFANGNHLLDNRRVARRAVAEAVALVRNKGFAATKADVFGHSMGGLLSRLYTTNVLHVAGEAHATNYRRFNNFLQGDIHKLITVNTPNYASPVADMLVQPNGELTNAGLGAQVYTGRCVDCGAVFDLRTDSPVIMALNSTFVPLPVHVFWGNGEFATPDHYYTKDKASSVGKCNLTLQQLMSGDSDAVVPVDSQRADLPSANRSIFPAAQGLHWPTIHDCPCDSSARAVELLNTAVGGGAFAAGFPDLNPVIPPTPECNIAWIPGVAASVGNDGIVITSPGFGEVFQAGDTVTVVVEPTGAFAPELVDIHMVRASSLADEAVSLTAPPFEAQFLIPLDHLGDLHFAAQGFQMIDGVWTGAMAQNVEGLTETTATLTGITANPIETNLSVYGPTTRIRARGTFSDGVERRLTAASGTTYVSNDPAVVEAGASGVVTATGLGSTTVTASNGGFSVDVIVRVVSMPLDYDSDGTIGLADAAALSKCLAGPKSDATPLEATSTMCRDFFDTDSDDDIDLKDWSGFQLSLAP